MNKDYIKYALIAVAGYFAWDWWTKNKGSLFGGTTGVTGTLPTGSTMPTSTEANVAAQQAAAAAIAKAAADKAAADALAAANAARLQQQSGVMAGMSDDQIATCAAGGMSSCVEESDRRGMRKDHHNWNYYRAQYTGKTQPDPELWAPGTTTTPVLVSQYLSMRAAAGQSGMAGLGFGGWRDFPTHLWIT